MRNLALLLASLLALCAAEQYFETSDSLSPSVSLAGVSTLSFSARDGEVFLLASEDSTLAVSWACIGLGTTQDDARAAKDEVSIEETVNDTVAGFAATVPEGIEGYAVFRVLLPAGFPRVNIELASGKVEAKEVSTDITATLGQGEVSSHKTEGNLRYSTGNGNVSAKAHRGSVTASTGAGSISCTIGQLPPDAVVDLATGAGPVQLYLSNSASARIEASTGAGGIEIDGLYIDFETREDTNLTGTVGDGEADVTVRTDAGNIKLAGR
jgi:hypothetical protein